MDLVLKIVLTLGGLLLVFMGTGFMIDPNGSALDFGLMTVGAHGNTSARADFTAFFVVSGASFIWGAWAKRRDPLVIGAALMLIALAARLVSLVVDGPFEGHIVPMAVEAVLGIAALVMARRVHRAS
ncbi:DUF4345 family protein [Qipengyuania nanhaisediminis]|uniref:DUF4345 family protein n=1 Tax=Qipengyuania nanhaisediminis TaxID=604088 RepID=UPI0038B2BE58